MPATLPEDRHPIDRLSPLLHNPTAPPEQRGRSPWPQQPASARSKDKAFHVRPPGPPLYLLALFLAPADACEHIALWGMPLLGLGACALPHFRALFSTARPAERQGETMALVAALESVPQMVASPLAALAFTHLLQTPQLIFIACMAPVLLALLLLSTLRRATLQRADDALPADPRRSLLLDGAGESLPVAPTPALAQVVPASTRHLSFAE